jgi:hypothetical protein
MDLAADLQYVALGRDNTKPTGNIASSPSECRFAARKPGRCSAAPPSLMNLAGLRLDPTHETELLGTQSLAVPIGRAAEVKGMSAPGEPDPV